MEAEKQRLENERLKLEAEKLKLEAEKQAREEREAKEKKAREEREAKEKKAREEQDKQDALKKAEDEKKAAAEAAAKKKEDERRKTLEMKGLAYYPLPTTVYEGKNAEEWSAYIKEQGSAVSDGIAALAALQEQGMPFLLDLLSGAADQKSHNAYLSAVKAEYIHPNDLPKIIECLDRKWSTASRILALTVLSKRKESKDDYQLIAEEVDDIKTVSDANGSVSKLLETIAAK